MLVDKPWTFFWLFVCVCLRLCTCFCCCLYVFLWLLLVPFLCLPLCDKLAFSCRCLQGCSFFLSVCLSFVCCSFCFSLDLCLLCFFLRGVVPFVCFVVVCVVWGLLRNVEVFVLCCLSCFIVARSDHPCRIASKCLYRGTWAFFEACLSPPMFSATATSFSYPQLLAQAHIICPSRAPCMRNFLITEGCHWLHVAARFLLTDLVLSLGFSTCSLSFVGQSEV